MGTPAIIHNNTHTIHTRVTLKYIYIIHSPSPLLRISFTDWYIAQGVACSSVSITAERELWPHVRIVWVQVQIKQVYELEYESSWRH